MNLNKRNKKLFFFFINFPTNKFLKIYSKIQNMHEGLHHIEKRKRTIGKHEPYPSKDKLKNIIHMNNRRTKKQ